MIANPFAPSVPKAATCEAQTGWIHDDYGQRPRTCHQWRGLRGFTAPDGSRHRYCAAEGHEARVRARVRRMIG